MTLLLASPIAALSRAVPFERGRWRIGALAQRLVRPEALRGERRTIATRHGFRMNLDLAELVDRTIWSSGEWEPLETDLIRQVLRPGDSFADVGANIGYFSLLAAQLVGPAGKVHAFEANPRTFDLLCANIALNGGPISPHLVALGESSGTAWVAHPEEGNAGADFMVFEDPGHGQAIGLARLDALLADPALRLIKIDIEGAEAKAIRGAEALLLRADAPDLVFEFTPDFLRRAGDDPAQLPVFLASRGYHLQEIGKGGLGALPADLLTRRQTYIYASKRSAS
ncbi:MAG: FkbM family methyltransferase [Novosphingobium sp.]